MSSKDCEWPTRLCPTSTKEEHMIGPLAANTAKTLRRTTTGYGSGSDFEAGTSFMATLEPQSG